MTKPPGGDALEYKERDLKRYPAFGFLCLIVVIAGACAQAELTPTRRATFTPTAVPTATPTPTPVPTATPNWMTVSFTIAAPAGRWQFLSEVFSKYVSVFGVHVFATDDTPDSMVIHASNVLAQYLDNDADGTPDNPSVVGILTVDEKIRDGRMELALADDFSTSIVMVATEHDISPMFESVPEKFYEMIDQGKLRVQELYGDQTNPTKAEGRFDASLKEVLHLITSAGYSWAYPDVFDEKAGSTIASYMDNARGGHFEESRVGDCEDDEPNEDWQEGQCALPPNGEYPKDAWYTNFSTTCSYACMVAEYFYWALTALLGAQSDNERCDDISDQWVLCAAEQVKSKDPNIYNLLTAPQYALPTTLPDGNYAPSSR